MKRRILLLVLTAFALLAGATATSDRAHPSAVVPWCPPYCCPPNCSK
jgi:hypothetical protein